MGVYLNTITPYENYKTISTDPYFVDKSMLLEELIPALGREQRFFCITRPRRFGKTVMANMISAFFGKAKDSHAIFQNLNIAGSPNYPQYRNNYHVFHIDCSEIPKGCNTYKDYIARIEHGICCLWYSKKQSRNSFLSLMNGMLYSIWHLQQNPTGRNTFYF